MNNVVRKRGRPPKARHDALRDQAASDLASCQDVWVRVETAKRQRPDLSRDSICELLVKQAKRAKERAPRRYKEVLASQKYLFNRNSFRRLYYRADALVQSDPRLAEYCETEVKRRMKES
jgi:hypothetical protein